MIPFGQTLRDAREAKGFTVSQIADITHLKSSLVEQLENEDFSSIAAPIYGRGFVKLYCEAVGLDPKPLVAEFMAIINGEHEVSIKERHPATAPRAALQSAQQPPQPTPMPVQQPLPMPVQQPMPHPVQQPVPQPVQQPVPMPLQQPISQPVQPPMPQSAPQFQPAGNASASRYARPIDNRRTDPIGLPPFVNPRVLILAAIAVVVAIVFIFGLRALYHATSSNPSPADTKSAPAATTAPAPASATVPAAPRAEQQEIPALYID